MGNGNFKNQERKTLDDILKKSGLPLHEFNYDIDERFSGHHHYKITYLPKNIFCRVEPNPNDFYPSLEIIYNELSDSTEKSYREKSLVVIDKFREWLNAIIADGYPDLKLLPLESKSDTKKTTVKKGKSAVIAPIKSFKIFISFVSKNKYLADQIHDTLEGYGFSAFIAHKDIKPSKVWIDTLRDELKKCDVVLPIITKEFSDSVWTDQEIGLAMGLDKLIIPLSVDAHPEGFLTYYQAIVLPTTKELPVQTLANIIISDEKLGEKAMSFFMTKLRDSKNKDAAGKVLELISTMETFSADLFASLIDVYMSNKHLQNDENRAKMKTLASKHKDVMDESLQLKYYKADIL